jgi:hypothetical protein
MASKRSNIFSFALSRQDLCDIFIEKYGFPEDIVITKFDEPLNQEAFAVHLHSPEFREHGDLDILSTARPGDNYKWKKED